MLLVTAPIWATESVVAATISPPTSGPIAYTAVSMAVSFPVIDSKYDQTVVSGSEDIVHGVPPIFAPNISPSE